MHETIDRPPRLPPRPRDGHKGTFGSVGILGGSAGDDPRMIGAPALAALGAARSGCGLVRIAAPAPVLDAVLTVAPFATGMPFPVSADGSIDPTGSVQQVDALVGSCDALAVGMGVGRSPGVDAVVLRAVLQEARPCVLDADAINTLCAIPAFWEDCRADLVLTPHPGEARRMLDALAMRDAGNPAGTPDERVSVCIGISRRLGCVVVLKGSGSIVSDGLQAWTCTAGGPALGAGGTGDVLAGVIAGLVAQHGRDIGLYECARAGVEAHAHAGDAWQQRHRATGGMTPSDLAGLIPGEVERLRRS
ncbi:MAG: NAD(P)H-hydrate dehydratase [Planctomycetota bacterium]